MPHHTSWHDDCFKDIDAGNESAHPWVPAERSMIRFVFTSVCLLGIVSSVLAHTKSPDNRERVAEEMLKALVLTPPKQEYSITAQTKILLNGNPCNYNEVPPDAIVIRMEFASSNDKEILKIHFRSATGPVKTNPRQVENRLTPAKKTLR
jgi:hypothetical protein